MGGAELEEVVAALKRSSAPTLVVEGRDDYIAFSNFEVENIHWGLTVLPVNGEGNVRKIIDRLPEIAHPALAVLLDRDCTLFKGIPPELVRSGTIFTDGYSIENDLIRDGNIVALVRRTDTATFEAELKAFAQFCSCAAYGHIEDNVQHPLSTHPSKIFRSPGQLHQHFADFIEDVSRNIPEAYRLVLDSPLRFARGKGLLDLFVRHFNYRRRGAKFSRASLLEIGEAAEGPLMRRIQHDVLTHFNRGGL